jgi:hypothetical protein
MAVLEGHGHADMLSYPAIHWAGFLEIRVPVMPITATSSELDVHGHSRYRRHSRFANVE